ncbi:uncharacterized protein LOC143424169 [Xylocopa sonorina]|uniref:uncharacterized protein LOC143424169 n=1 Tax=Xylocopa sonorina TaxID=1818115 RepID=UPI00403AAF41
MKIGKLSTLFLIFGLSLVLVADVEAGWKFWKKKDKDATTTTTIAPEITNPEPTKANSPPGGTPTTKKPPKGSMNNVGPAVIGLSDPGLAIGVGSTGEKVKQNARPNRPNPGTEVGLDIPVPKPGKPGVGGTTGQGYRDWAVDLTGAGEPGRQSPKLPAEGPALGGGSRPGSVSGGVTQPGAKPGNVPSQPPSPGAGPAMASGATPQPRPNAQPIPQSRPSAPGTPAPATRPATAPGQPQPMPNQPGAGGNQVSTLRVGTLKPGAAPTPAPSSRPGSPGSPTMPGKTWADVAGGGSRPNSPTAAPKQPGYPGQPQPGPQTPTQPGKPGLSTGKIAGGALAAGALAGGALAAGSGTGTTTANNKVYSSNPTYSKGNTITDEDLEKLSEALFIKDNNNANKYITINLQKQTTSSSTTDDAPQPLFTVNAQAYQGPTISKVITIYDNYKPETNVNEHISPLQRQEESLLVDTFLSTNVMSAAMRFLADKGKIQKDYYEYKDTLRKIWFNLFSRGQGKIGSSGFEHVFMAELKTVPTGTEVVGLHNWIYYSKEEVSGKADYNGYLKKVDLGDKASILKIRTKYSGKDKPVTTLFVGTSPELEMALYTVCFYARPDGNCPVSLGRTKFNIVTYKFKYRGNDLVGTAYPDI